jgi:hypothetical protein
MTPFISSHVTRKCSNTPRYTMVVWEKELVRQSVFCSQHRKHRPSDCLARVKDEE